MQQNRFGLSSQRPGGRPQRKKHVAKEQSQKKPAEFTLSSKHLACLYSIAYDYFETGAFATAQVLYQGLVELRPQKVEYHLGLALTRERLGAQQQARDTYRKALSLEPLNPVVILYVAQFCLTQGENKNAELLLSRVIQHADSDELTQKARVILALIRKVGRGVSHSSRARSVLVTRKGV